MDRGSAVVGRAPSILPWVGLRVLAGLGDMAATTGSSTGMVELARLATRPVTNPTSLSSNYDTCAIVNNGEPSVTSDEMLTRDILIVAKSSSVKDIEKLFVCCPICMDSP